jgi:hypothetical protein
MPRVQVRDVRPLAPLAQWEESRRSRLEGGGLDRTPMKKLNPKLSAKRHRAGSLSHR